MKYRNQYDIIESLLENAIKPATKNRICVDLGSNHQAMKKYFIPLLENGFLANSQKVEVNNKNFLRDGYAITPKGHELLIAIRKVKEMLNNAV